MSDNDAFKEPRGVSAPQNPDGTPADGQPYTRSTVAAALRVSITTVRRWEGRLLHPRRGHDGTHLFDATEVESLAQRRPVPVKESGVASPGEIAAAAFALFKEGVTIRDAVIELEQPPDVIQRLHEDWERFGGRLVLDEEVLKLLDRISAARLIDGDFVMAIWNNDAESLSAFLDEKLQERQRLRLARQ